MDQLIGVVSRLWPSRQGKSQSSQSSPDFWCGYASKWSTPLFFGTNVINVDFNQSISILWVQRCANVEPCWACWAISKKNAACRKASRQVLAENGELVETAAKIQVWHSMTSLVGVYHVLSLVRCKVVEWPFLCLEMHEIHSISICLNSL